jgi:hypothetical protein
MARPKPIVITEKVNKKTYKSLQVLKADSIYTVCYKDSPINVRTLNTLVDYPGPKYKKVSFVNAGSAFNLADKLNKEFETTEFSVVQMVSGKKITENEYKST